MDFATKEKKIQLEAEVARVKAKVWASSDPDVVEGLKLKLKGLETELEELNAQILAAEEAEAAAKPVEAAPTAAMETPREKDPKRDEEVLQYIRTARVERGRKNFKAAVEQLEKARKLDPKNPEVLELIADDLIAQNKLNEAVDVLKQAKELSPNSVGIERKYATTVLRAKDVPSLEEQMSANLSDMPMLSSADRVASVSAATWMTVFLPGAGHFVLGQNRTGGTIMGIWVFCVFLVFLFRDQVTGFLGMVGIGNAKSTGMFVLLPMAVAFITHLAALQQMGALQKKGISRAKVEHPKPPVDLPFE